MTETKNVRVLKEKKGELFQVTLPCFLILHIFSATGKFVNLFSGFPGHVRTLLMAVQKVQKICFCCHSLQ